MNDRTQIPPGGFPGPGQPAGRPPSALSARPAAVEGGSSGAGLSAEPVEERPPAAFLNLPVVVRSGEGEHLGVTSKSGRAFTLAQFETFLAQRAEGLGRFEAKWLRRGQEWTLRLSSQGQAHDHLFLKAQTSRGNTVARFASLSVGGKPVSDVALQAFLRQVKETLDQ